MGKYTLRERGVADAIHLCAVILHTVSLQDNNFFVNKRHRLSYSIIYVLTGQVEITEQKLFVVDLGDNHAPEVFAEEKNFLRQI